METKKRTRRIIVVVACSLLCCCLFVGCWSGEWTPNDDDDVCEFHATRAIFLFLLHIIEKLYNKIKRKNEERSKILVIDGEKW